MPNSLYDLNFNEHGVFLKVNVPGGHAQKDEILKSLTKKHIKGFDAEEVERAIERSGQEIMIAPAQEASVSEDAIVTVDRSLMSVTIEFSPPQGGSLLSETEIRNLLRQAGVVYGIDDANVSYLADNPDKPYNEQINIANGEPAADGRDAELKIHFKVVRDKTPKILENGQVDHRNLDIVESVAEGALLATLTPEEEGKPGMNVRGQVLKCKKGKPRSIPKGKNTELSEDKLRLYSSANGSVEIKNGMIEVINVMDIKGDVGPATGSINFLGDVTISGNIASTYNVKASGTINVGGVIEASNIDAGGDVIIRQGIKGLSASGKMSCVIKAGGNVTAKFIESASVYANGNVRADAILHSEIYAGDSVISAGKHGIITGGRIRAYKDIVCNDIGSRTSNIKTMLEVGAAPGVRENAHRTKKEIDAIEKEMAEVSDNIKELAAAQPLNHNQLLRLKTLSEKNKQLEDRLAPLRRENEQLAAQLSNSRQGRVHIKRVMNPDVSITIGGTTEQYRTEYSSSSFVFRDGEGIALMPYSYAGN